MPRTARSRGITSEEEKKYWLDVDREAVIKSIEVTEDAAKQLVTLTTLLQGIYFAAISYSDIREVSAATPVWQVILLVTPLILWLISLYYASSVLIPRRYSETTDENGAEASTRERDPWDIVRIEYQQIRDTKFNDLRYARSAMLCSLVVLAIDLSLYLAVIPSPLSC